MRNILKKLNFLDVLIAVLTVLILFSIFVNWIVKIDSKETKVTVVLVADEKSVIGLKPGDTLFYKDGDSLGIVSSLGVLENLKTVSVVLTGQGDDLRINEEIEFFTFKTSSKGRVYTIKTTEVSENEE